ncbi:MAG TPA: TolC family protein [Acidobacteriaceae bacterium]|jgi:outer membrane protein TolC|nr:TolC family protein [Acidobacteriaceae bacterium]
MCESKDRRNQRGAIRKLAAILFLTIPVAASAQISLSTAVDLAEKSSPAVRSAQANVRKAIGSLSESEDAYVPNVVLGANPGYVYGYPLGYPSLFEANSQSLILSFSQRDYIRAARQGVNSAKLSLRNTQQEVALDVALAYVQLDHDLREMAALDEEKAYAENLVNMEQERVNAGVDASVATLRAQLTAAQVDEKHIQLENDANDMRLKISHLTGLPAVGFTTISGSIPPQPAVSASSGIDEQPPDNNPGVAAAYAKAKSRQYQAFGDQRQNYRPLITFGAQYSLFEKFANYTQYFPNGLQYNNAAIGVVVTFPIFDASRRARARESAADADYAWADADAARNTLSEQEQTLRGSVRQLAAQQRVAQLESDLAQAQLKTVETQLANGTGNAGAQPISPIEAQNAHIEERQRFEDMLDANFSLIRVELNFLRTTGGLDAWLQSALASPSPPAPMVGAAPQPH